MDLRVERVDKYTWRIPKTGKMRVNGIVFTDAESINDPQFREALKQVMNVATLVGIVRASFAMPDMHWGYGFPIGGVAAFDEDEGIISPGGVGFDINCGVRLLKTDLSYFDIKDKIERIARSIFEYVPVGVGERGKLKLSHDELRRVCELGARWAVEKGYGEIEDLKRIEDEGRLKDADPSVISFKAYERGKDELGTLGGGNHFIEVQKVDRIYDEEVARFFGLFDDTILIMVHTGSRGFGHQVATDYIQKMRKELSDHNKDLPDMQLINAPFKSDLGCMYYRAMCCAANYAWANRQIITHLIRAALKKALSMDVKIELIYDVAHNIAKLEEHMIDGKKLKVVVHRKGATRAFGPENPAVPEIYRRIGQPVLIPGDMGTASYLLIGTKKAEKMTFGTTAHGAGRVKGRREALRTLNYSSVMEELKKKEIIVIGKSKKTLIEEAPQAYKDVDRIAEIVDSIGISKKIARFVPLAVVKG